MDKISVFCVSQFIEKFNTDSSSELLDNVNEVSMWLAKSVRSIFDVKSFDFVQRELISLAGYITTGKRLTRRSCARLISSLKEMQKEILSRIKIVLFVMPTIKLEFNDGVNVVVVENEEECINLAYDMQDELKYLLYMNSEDVTRELYDAVDVIVTFEELFKASDACYPIDNFTYDRLYLTAKLDKMEKEQSRVLLTGNLYAVAGLIENKMLCSASNIGINGQDLYYTLLSVKEAIARCENLDRIVIPFPYYFFFSDITKEPSEYMLKLLSKVNFPMYKKLHGYSGELLPVYSKVQDFPMYEAIVSLESVRDIYHLALMKDLEQMEYYNSINIRPPKVKFSEKSDEENFSAGRSCAQGYNVMFDLDIGLYNQKLLDKFLDNMEELNKKVILFTPPAIKFYRDGVLADMINAYYQLVMPVVNSHKCCKFIDLFDSDEFNESDFYDYEYLNMDGANKLSEIIARS